MSQEWTSRVLSVLLTVLMVTSMVAPVTATSTSSTQEGASSNFDLSGATDDPAAGVDSPTGDESDAQSALSGGVQASTMPPYAQADLADVDVTIGSPSSNKNGIIKMPVRVDGTYAEGQYPWRIPVTVTVFADGVSESTVVMLAPDKGSKDYTASSQFTLQFVQDSSTDRTITARAVSQVGDRDSDETSATYTVNGVSDERDVTTSGQIRNRDLSEYPNTVTHVSRYRASTRASGYLEDASIPVGHSSNVSNFTHIRDANNQYALFESFRGDMNVGTLTTGVPNATAQTLVIRYRALTGDDIKVTPVDSGGYPIDGDTSYTLPADPATSANCHSDPDNAADICVFRLSDMESSRIGAHHDFILEYHTNEMAELAVFCQDIVTGAMPDSGTVCGLGDVGSYSDGRIVELEASGGGNLVTEEDTLHISSGTQFDISVTLENMGDEPVSGTLRLASTDPANYSTPLTRDVSLGGGQTKTVTFNDFTLQERRVSFTASFDDSHEVIHVKPSGLDDQRKPVASSGSPYIVPLEEIGTTETLIGMQRQTLTERPGSEWTQVGEAGSSDGTDEWTTYVDEVPVIGTISGLESTGDNITYMNNVLASRYDGVTVDGAYQPQIEEARQQLPPSTDASEWHLHDVRFTSKVRGETTIDTERPTGYGWEKIDKYDDVPTGEYEYERFRIRPSALSDGEAIEPNVDGEGWIRTDAPAEKQLVGYMYNNTTTDPDLFEPDHPNDSVHDWEKYQYYESRYVVDDPSNFTVKYQDEKYDPGPNWTYQGKVDGQHKYVKPTYKTVDVWTWRAPVYDYYFQFKRPITETAYEWERQVYDAEFIFQRDVTASTVYEWEGPLYDYQTEYEEETVELNGTHSFDRGPSDLAGLSEYEWTFEDGTTASGETTTRTYGTPFGTYRPDLQVWDFHGNTDVDRGDVRVKPASRFCEEDNTCDPYPAVPDLEITETNGPAVDYNTESIFVSANISGHLHDREWVVNIRSPDAAHYQKEIWRSYNIIDGEQKLNAYVEPEAAGLPPGEVTLELVATPADANHPVVRDNVTVYLCDPTEGAMDHQNCQNGGGGDPEDPGCDFPASADPDGDCIPNEEEEEDEDCDHEYSKDNIFLSYYYGEFYIGEDCLNHMTATEKYIVEHTSKWHTSEDWETAEDRRHVIQFEQTNYYGTTYTDEFRLGYSQLNTWQRENYPNLEAWYAFEHKSLEYATNNHGDWEIEDSSPNDNWGAVFYDNDPNDNGGDFSRAGDDGWQKAPKFDDNGIYGSRSVHWDDETQGHIEMVAPYCEANVATFNNDPSNDYRRPCDDNTDLQDNLHSNTVVSFWAAPAAGGGLFMPDEYDITYFHYSMQDENNNNVDTAAQHHRIHMWRDCYEGNSQTPICNEGEDWITVQRYADTGGSVDTLGVMDTDDEDINPNAALRDFDDKPWQHYTYVVDGGPYGSDTLYIYKNGELIWAKSVADIYGSSTAENRWWLMNDNPPDKNLITRFIWGGTWSDLDGLIEVNDRTRYDDVRIYSTVPSESMVQNRYYIDGEGYIKPTEKWANDSSLEPVPTDNVSVKYFGDMTNNGRVLVEVIPWEGDSQGDIGTPRPGASKTVEFNDSTPRELDLEPFEGVGNATQFQINVTIQQPESDGVYTSQHQTSPTVDQIHVTAEEEVVEVINTTVPIAYLTLNSSSVPAGEDIKFTGNASYDPDDDGHIESYSYDVVKPSGETVTVDTDTVSSGSEIPSVSYTPTCAGEYSAELTVTDNEGAPNKTAEQFTVTNDPPTADAYPDTQTIKPGETAQFNAFNSTDPDGSIESYTWTFDDGATQSGSTASRTYNEEGEYPVTLTVEDDACETDSETVTVIVQNDPPVADAGPDQEAQPDEEVTFDGSNSYDPDGTIEQYEWDVDGDGTYEYSSSTATATHTYSNEGTYTVTLRVTDDTGNTDTDTATVTIEQQYMEYTWIDADFDDGMDGFSTANSAGRGTHTSNSGSYSAYTRHTSGSRIVSPTADLSDAKNVSLSWWVRGGSDSFSEDIDSGEDLKVQYKDSSGSWNTLHTYNGGSGARGTTYTGSVDMPSGAYHSNLQIRFYQTGGSGSDYDYWHIDDVQLSGWTPEPSGDAIGETGSYTLSANDANDWHTVSFQNSYNDPVIVVKPLSYNGGHPAHIRVANVGSASADIKIEEWEYLDGSHTTETVHYVVMEKGDWQLDDGTHVAAGTVSADDSWSSISFPSSFSSTPTVFSKSQTYNGGDPIVTRNDNVGTGGFSVKVQEDEANGPHTTETVGYIAIDQGTGTTNNIAFEAYDECDCFDDSWTQIDFAQSYGSDRNIIIDSQRYDGGNTMGLRYDNFNSGNIDVMVEEEQSSDDEMSHTQMPLGYWVIDSDGSINGSVK